MNTSDKSRGVAFVLALMLGVFGAHRFYVGKTGTAILMLCTVGGLGLWYLYDVVQVAAGNFTDARGRRVRRWNFEERDEPSPTVTDELIEEIEALRREVAELAERVDFAERLLQRPEREGGRSRSSA
jgi:hypothetical protein